MFLGRALAALLLLLASSIPSPLFAQDTEVQGIRENIPSGAILWREPHDITSRDLFYGAGGQENAPTESSFSFVREDSDGTNPKFEVRDTDGTIWKIKLGREARSETVATRFLWAVGYHADEDYVVPQAVIAQMPRLKRGQSLVGPGGTIQDARFERVRDKVIGPWRWKKNPHAGTRELNGLRVVMSLINNWDLKDSNNAIVQLPASGANSAQIFLVGDLGATFGATGFSWPISKTRSNLKEFQRSKFISKVTDSYVDFKSPSRPALIRMVVLPDYIKRLRLRWIGRRIPKADVQWISQYLAQLSPKQIRDAFRAGGYAPDEVEGFAQVVETRIADLKGL